MVDARRLWHTVAAVSGAAAVGLGAYGAHRFRPDKEYFSEVFQRGQQYHLIRTALLGIAPLARRPHLVGGLAAAGIACFCGSCYTAAVLQDRSYGKLAPVGGFAFIGAWLALAL